MKTETPFLDFYKKAMKSGFIPMTCDTGGLCFTAPLSNERNNLVDLFEPQKVTVMVVAIIFIININF